jgi:hypothetical protein
MLLLLGLALLDATPLLVRPLLPKVHFSLGKRTYAASKKAAYVAFG